MSDANGLAEALLGLGGFRVLAVSEAVELVVVIETVQDFVGSSSCVVRAEKDCIDVKVRDLACFGRPRPTGVAQAVVALHRRRLRGADLDRDLAGGVEPSGPNPPGRCGGVPPGRHERPTGGRPGPGARGVLVDGDGRRGRARDSARSGVGGVPRGRPRPP